MLLLVTLAVQIKRRRMLTLFPTLMLVVQLCIGKSPSVSEVVMLTLCTLWCLIADGNARTVAGYDANGSAQGNEALRIAAAFRFFSGSFFYTYTNLFPSYCFSDDGTAEQPQECLTTFPVIISFAFLLRLIIYFISVEVQPSAIPDSRLLISLSISFSLPDKLIS